MRDSLLPLFPLEVVLLPGELLPLHIFEERYKQMVGECLEAESHPSAHREFGVVLAKEEELAKVGCTARIAKVTRRYDDGRLDILTVGQRRFEILSTNDEATYLRGSVNFFDDDEGAATPPEALTGRALDLFRQVAQRLQGSDELPPGLKNPERRLSFRLAAPLPLDLDFKQQLLMARNEIERLRELTDAMKNLITRLDFTESVRAKAGGNGHLHARRDIDKA